MTATKPTREVAVFDLEREVLRAVKQAQQQRERSSSAAVAALGRDCEDPEQRTRWQRIAYQHAELAQAALLLAIKLAADLPSYPDMPGI
jgi:DNA-binding TFAR19-related protein (PDSD5 family)